jgi:hypothetical protein
MHLGRGEPTLITDAREPARRASQGDDMTFWQYFWLLAWAFLFVAWLMLLFSVFADLFRDRELGGVGKALWVIFLIVLPLVGVLIYLIVRGRGMSERSAAQVKEVRQAQEDYIRSVAGPTVSPAAQIAEAKALLASGDITTSEFEALKAKALG